MSRILERDNSLRTKVAGCTIADLLLGRVSVGRYTFKAIGVCLEELVDAIFHEVFGKQKLKLGDCGLDSGARRLRLRVAYLAFVFALLEWISYGFSSLVVWNGRRGFFVFLVVIVALVHCDFVAFAIDFVVSSLTAVGVLIIVEQVTLVEIIRAYCFGLFVE